MTESAIHTVTMRNLAKLQECCDAETALALCREIYTLASVKYPGHEVLRAIESRLPMPTASQAECVSTVTLQDITIVTRPLGAIGDQVIYCLSHLLPWQEGPVLSVQFAAVRCRPDREPDTPKWDPLFPLHRRKPIQVIPSC